MPAGRRLAGEVVQPGWRRAQDARILLVLHGMAALSHAHTCLHGAWVQGIEVKMVTGDHLLIGKETARQLGMGDTMFQSEILIKVGCLAGWLVAGVC